jgi:TRAP-type C4-dicarboxylate transport system substrate-binding protein
MASKLFAGAFFPAGKAKAPRGDTDMVTKFVIASGAAVALFAAAPDFNASAKELIYGSGMPDKSTTMSVGSKGFFDDLEKASKGQLKFKILASGQVVTLVNAMEGLRDGLVDSGFIVPVFNRKTLLYSNVLFDMQAFGSDAAAVTGAVAETMLLDCPKCADEYNKQNIVMLASYANTPYNLMCNKPVKSLADVANLKIRTDGVTARLARAMNAVPVNITPVEATTALQRGGVDCVLGGIAWLTNFGYMDSITHVIEHDLGSPRAFSFFAMNREAWKSLPLDQKKLILENLPMGLARLTFVANIKADDDIRKLGKDKGLVFTKGGKEFDDLMAKHKKSEQTAVANVMKELGVQNPEEVMNIFQKNLAKWEKISSERVKGNMEEFAKVLKEEIYSKLDPAKL